MFARRLALLTLVVLVLWCCTRIDTHAGEGESPPDEKQLKDARLPTDGPGLLNFFRKLTPSAADQARFRAAIQTLGDKSFRTREQAARDLLQAGRAALPFLHAALKDPDIEIARRARRCIDSIEAANNQSQLILAARALAARQPAGAVEVLLAYTPFTEDEISEEEVRQALFALGLREGKAAAPLVAALANREPARRAAAVSVVGRATDPAQREAATRLLEDADVSVRFQAAAALLRSREKAAVPVLIALLADAPPSLAWRAEDLLFRLAEEKAPTISLSEADAASRRRCREAWEGWWKSNVTEVDFAKVQLEARPLGLTLICEAQRAAGDRVGEWDRDGKPRWTIKTTNPLDVQLLPGGRVLVAESNGNRVVEMNREGQVLWSHQITSPLCCQRLPNGRTFMANYTSVLEVTREGKVVFSYPRSHVYHAQKLANGHILCIDNRGEVVELDAAGKELHKVNTGAGGGQTWASVEALPGGRYLVALGGNNKVKEVDRTGKVYWERSVNNPNSATRLPNGNTLVASHNDKCVYEFDRTGKEVWRRPMEGGSPFRARRR